MLSVDAEAKTASLFLIDYGIQDDAVALGDMRKTLICFEYAAQAHKCRMSKYPGPSVPAKKEELEELHDLLVDQPCVVQVAPGSIHPSVIDIRLQVLNADEMDAYFNQLRPSRPSVRAADPKDSGSDDDDNPIFDFNFRGMKYRSLDVPARRLLPIRIVRMAEDEYGMSVFIQPARHAPNDSPSNWQQQVDDFARLDTELQRSAPLFPDIPEVVEAGRPCAACLDGRWHRGIVRGCADGNVSVELVDVGIVVEMSKVKQLPNEFLSVPRHSIKSLLIDYKIHPIDPRDLNFVRLCVEKGTPLIAFFKV